jgi:hypothetical protein
VSIAPTGTVYAELQPVLAEYDRHIAKVFDHYRRELDVLFAADLDELIRDTGPETQEWPAYLVDVPDDAASYQDAYQWTEVQPGWVPEVPEGAQEWLDQGPAPDEQLPGGHPDDRDPLLPWLADAAGKLWGRR